MLQALEGSIWLYFVIFFGKIFEVSVSTVRIVLINRGERVKGTIVAVFEMMLWLTITGTVLVGFQQDLTRGLVFSLAFAAGNYVGSWTEEKLAFCYSSIQVILPDSDASRDLAALLRANSFAVTVVKGRGKDLDREILFLHAKRKRIPEAVRIINTHLANAVIVINDSRFLHGGFIKK